MNPKKRALDIYKQLTPEQLKAYNYSSVTKCQFELFCLACPAQNLTANYHNCSFASTAVEKIFTAMMKEKHPELFL